MGHQRISTVASALPALVLAGCATSMVRTSAPQDGAAAAAPIQPLEGVADFLSSNDVEIRGATSKASVLKDEPAQLQLTDPSGDGNTTTLADIGVTWTPEFAEFGKYGDLTLGATIEHHRNTAEGKQQDNTSAGLLVRYYGGHADVSRDPAVPVLFPTWVAQLDAEYKSDEVADTDGAQLKLTVAPIVSDLMRVPDKMGNNHLTLGTEVGLLYEDADSDGGDGDVLRSLVSGDITWYPAPLSMSDRWQVFARGTYWHDLDQDGRFDGLAEDRRIVRFGTALYFDSKNRIGATLEHVNGSNPETGLRDQEYIALTLAVKF